MRDIGELIERLEKLDGPDRVIDAEIAVTTRWRPLGIHHWVDDHPAGMSASQDARCAGWVVLNDPPVPVTKWESPPYTASLDAAVALVERMLPGVFWLLSRGRLSAAEPEYGAQLLFGADEIIGAGEGPTAPLATLLALLRALPEKEPR